MITDAYGSGFRLMGKLALVAFLSILQIKADSGEAKTMEEWLEDKNMEIGEENDDGESLAHFAAQEGRLDVLEWLKTQGANIKNEENRNGWTPLLMAAYGGHIEAMKWFKEHGIDLDRE